MLFMQQSKNKKILFAVFLLLLAGGVLYLAWRGFSDNAGGKANNPEPVFCTQEAKLCPDGSYVGRIGPNCEFAVCPE
jgi:hypothetical protein